MPTRFIVWCLLLASALSASAQWSTNWPAVSNAWWAYSSLEEECFNASNERLEAHNLYAPRSLAGGFWFVHRSHLIDIADAIEDACVIYVNIEDTRGTNETYDTWFDSNDTLPAWTVTGLISSVSASTSIYWAAEDAGGWDYFANDYPKTLDEFKAAINKLTELRKTGVGTGLTWDRQGENNRLTGSATNAVWATAKSNAEGAATTTTYNLGPRKTTDGEINGGVYSASLGSIYTYANSTTWTTNYHSRCDIYHYADAAIWPSTFDGNGDGFREAKYSLINSSPITNLTTRYIPIGDTNQAVGVWVSTPVSASSRGIGYVTPTIGPNSTEMFSVDDYSVTNGFNYVP